MHIGDKTKRRRKGNERETRKRKKRKGGKKRVESDQSAVKRHVMTKFKDIISRFKTKESAAQGGVLQTFNNPFKLLCQGLYFAMSSFSLEI